jgi:hypothetical protein
MNLFEFILAVLVIRYLYKIIMSFNSSSLKKEDIVNIITKVVKPALIDQHKDYVKLHDEFLTKVIDANGDVLKIVQESDNIIKKLKEKEEEINSIDAEQFKKLKNK